MNILLWAPYGAGDHYWGPGMSAKRLYETPIDKEFKIYLAHGYPKQEKLDDLFEEQYLISELKANNRLSEVQFLIKSFFFIRKNHDKFSVVHILGFYEISFRPAIWFEKYKVPTFCKITSLGEGLNQNSTISKLLRLKKFRIKNLNTINSYIAISNEIVENLKSYGVNESKIHKIPNGVDIDRFQPINAENKSKLRKTLNLSNTFTIIFVGGVSERKRPSEILKSIERITSRNNDVVIQTIIVGPPRDKVEIEKIKILKQNSRNKNSIILIEENVSPEKYYQAGDIFCLPSTREGMSNALLEALSSGLPSIVSNISGSNELVIHGKTGFISNVGIEMDKYILELYSNKDLLIEQSLNARKHILKNYSSQSVLKRHLSLFDAIKT